MTGKKAGIYRQKNMGFCQNVYKKGSVSVTGIKVFISERKSRRTPFGSLEKTYRLYWDFDSFGGSSPDLLCKR